MIWCIEIDAGAVKYRPGVAVGKNEGVFTLMQLGIYRHRHQSGMPDGEHDFYIFWPVFHDDGNPVSAIKAGKVFHATCQACNPV